MAKLQKLPVIKETEVYDDLLAENSKTKALLEQIKAGKLEAPPKKKPKIKKKGDEKSLSDVKVLVTSQVSVVKTFGTVEGII